MDLSDLYTPQELAEKRISFLERVLAFYNEIPETADRARTVGHKLRGTGGNLGLADLAERGTALQWQAQEGASSDVLKGELARIRPQIEAAIARERAILSERGA